MEERNIIEEQILTEDDGIGYDIDLQLFNRRLPEIVDEIEFILETYVEDGLYLRLWFDYIDGEVQLWGKRFETEGEYEERTSKMHQRITEGIKYHTALLKDERRKLYEELRKEFGSEPEPEQYTIDPNPYRIQLNDNNLKCESSTDVNWAWVYDQIKREFDEARPNIHVTFLRLGANGTFVWNMHIDGVIFTFVTTPGITIDKNFLLQMISRKMENEGYTKILKFQKLHDINVSTVK